jgi:starch synthase
MEKKRVLLVTQEMDPYLVLTEIGNIVKKIAPFVHDNGLEVRILMPRFGIINERRNRLHEVVRLSGINIIIDDEDHPLLIKVASLPGARIQVYFLDNEDFFKRKQIYRDDEEVFFDDNSERMIFFCKGVLETVRKFGWAPDIIHCHGWMSSLLPVYIKTVYGKDPVFSHTKTIMSVYESDFSEKLPEYFLQKAVVSDDIKPEDLINFQGLDAFSLNKGGVQFADAIVEGGQIVTGLDELKTIAGDKPWLSYEAEIDIAPKYLDFYKMLLS